MQTRDCVQTNLLALMPYNRANLVPCNAHCDQRRVCNLTNCFSFFLWFCITYQTTHVCSNLYTYHGLYSSQGSKLNRGSSTTSQRHNDQKEKKGRAAGGSCWVRDVQKTLLAPPSSCQSYVYVCDVLAEIKNNFSEEQKNGFHGLFIGLLHCTGGSRPAQLLLKTVSTFSWYIIQSPTTLTIK